jgi:hypothetical protein
MKLYLARHRHVLANMRGESPRPVGDALWVSSKGSPMTSKGIYWCITKRTREAFGHSISPHLFRDCAATSIAIDDPRHVGIAAPLLGHRSASTTEKYYNQAGSIEAARLMQNFPLSLRHSEPTPEEAGSQERRSPGLRAAPLHRRGGIPARRGCRSWSADTTSRSRIVDVAVTRCPRRESERQGWSNTASRSTLMDEAGRLVDQ